ncbi:FAD-dependent oxidoreductase [Streptomyces xanthochromogenes]|uniref:FAD-dependent oxidoreductase n=1 Tax=Streptomyces xanthochromogenes TaxID=67384 RepID=UPI003416B870
MPMSKAVVIGGGIAGLATAINLHHRGWSVTVVEKATIQEKDGSYLVLYPAATSAARRLGIMGDLPARLLPHYKITEVNRRGDRLRGAVSPLIFKPPPIAMLHGDLWNAIRRRVPEEVEIKYNASITSLRQTSDTVHAGVTDSSGDETIEEFDLLVGCDGVDSTVREMAFGPINQYAFSTRKCLVTSRLRHALPGFGPEEGISVHEPGRVTILFPWAGNRPCLSVYVDEHLITADLPQQDIFRTAVGMGTTGDILDRLSELVIPDSPTVHSATQITVPRYSKGRIVLLGDSAWCSTSASGMGAAAALQAAELLALALDRNKHLPDALTQWENTVRPLDRFSKSLGRHTLSILCTRTAMGKALRIAGSHGARLPVLSDLFLAAYKKALGGDYLARDLAAG